MKANKSIEDLIKSYSDSLAQSAQPNFEADLEAKLSTKYDATYTKQTFLNSLLQKLTMKNKSLQFKILVFTSIFTFTTLVSGILLNPTKAKDIANVIMFCKVEITCYEKHTSFTTKHGIAVSITEYGDNDQKYSLMKTEGKISYEIHKKLLTESEMKAIFIEEKDNQGIFKLPNGRIIKVPKGDDVQVNFEGAKHSDSLRYSRVLISEMNPNNPMVIPSDKDIKVDESIENIDLTKESNQDKVNKYIHDLYRIEVPFRLDEKTTLYKHNGNEIRMEEMKLTESIIVDISRLNHKVYDNKTNKLLLEEKQQKSDIPYPQMMNK